MRHGDNNKYRYSTGERMYDGASSPHKNPNHHPYTSGPSILYISVLGIVVFICIFYNVLVSKLGLHHITDTIYNAVSPLLGN